MRNRPLSTPRDNDAAERILAQLAAGALPDLSQFWHEVEAVGLPLVTKVKEHDDQRDVTFLWRADKPLQGVWLFLNRVTDKDHAALGYMAEVADNIWTLTLRLPASYCGSYTLTEIPPATSPEQLAQFGTRRPPFIGQADPLNKMPGINVGGETESVLALDQAPEQSEWATPGASGGEPIATYPVVAGKQRRVRLYLPDVPKSTPLGLLVLPDAEKWFDHVGVTSAIDTAINNGRIGPMAVLGIDNLDQADRATILGGDSQLVLDIARRLVPQARADHPDRVWADRGKTVLCGQSLGGVTALIAALHAPDIFGCVLSHSPSMWWSPDKEKRPFMFTANDASWVSEQMLATPPKEVQIKLCVGTLEGTTVPHVQQLHQRLLAAGVDSDLKLYTGGHDVAWWRGALIDGLATL